MKVLVEMLLMGNWYPFEFALFVVALFFAPPFWEEDALTKSWPRKSRSFRPTIFDVMRFFVLLLIVVVGRLRSFLDLRCLWGCWS